MLKPTIAALLEQLPADKLATTDAIYQILMTQFSVQVVCPYDTKQALKALVPTSS